MPFNLSAREKKLLFLLLLVIISFLFWRINVCQLIPELVQARMDLDLEKSNLLSAQEKIKKLPFLQALAMDIKDEVQNVENIFWQQMEPATLIKVLGQAGGEGLQITSVQPLEKKNGDLEEDERGTRNFRRCDYEIGVKGSYDAVLDFVYKLESEPSGRISYLKLQKEEETPLVRGLIVWRIYFLPGEQEKEVFFDTNFFRPDLFEPGSEPQAENAAATGEDVGDIVMEVITGTEITQCDLLPEDIFEENIEQEFYYPDLYSFPFKN
jgi:Tfp pilus assembly protein PilO